jgi:hypothetical protein
LTILLVIDFGLSEFLAASAALLMIQKNGDEMKGAHNGTSI